MSFLTRVVLRNWQLKLSAFGLAIFLWAVVQTESGQVSVTSFDSVPVLVQVNDPEWTLAEEPSPPTVQVRFDGPVQQLISLSQDPDALMVRVPIDGVSSADTTVVLRKDWVVTLGREGLVVQDIIPSTISIRLDSAATTVLPVALRTTGELPEGLSLAAPLGVNPQLVRVQGPKSRVQRLDSLSVAEPLDLSNVTSSGTYPVTIDTTGLGVNVESREILVAIRVDETVERTLEDVRVELHEEVRRAAAGGDSLRVDPPAVSVTVRGAGSVVRSLLDSVRVVLADTTVSRLEAGEERWVGLRVLGVPARVGASAGRDSVRVWRPAAGEPSGTPGAPASPGAAWRSAPPPAAGSR